MPETPTSPEEDLQLLRACAVTAGIIASGFFRREMKTWSKDGGSPVSEADVLIDSYLRK